ncbi:long-chain-fatty-acid--CoA ligase [Streptomyces pristinaespiralis]|uniref:Feruloyl-CoA synthetase n=2 Tax=Streptomyces pristinaespiralis TaxID=38300 RepID=B5H6T5_STRE2|nr:long-chain-fatty-acid--CoA ligase [Streptomyces pristinaespiralis]ALC18714.1 fatty-acid--CoA ligase [Streptomyces pristinaespiralis]EDY62546.1 feruloyl-CoA synthetase [Streptomyces pristinaespiralis ATCC 25486]QMU18123.1 long-chain-fatty-acid--CoA ligase [Streptomyces pristinaespiralis]
MYLTQSLHRAVQQNPERIATISGERVRTWRESGDRIARLAGALRALGAAEGDRVALLALNSDVHHDYLYAVWWAGCVVNPVNTRWSVREIAYSLEESDTRILLVDDAFAPLVPKLRGLWEGIATVIHCGDEPTPEGMLCYEELIAAHEPVKDERVGGERLAGIFYTGGTTGFPKGVMLSHANILSSANSLVVSVQASTPGGRTMYCAPMFHLAALGNWFVQNLVGGSHLFLPAFEPAAVLTAVADHRPTSTLLVPAMIQMLVDHPSVGEHDLTSLQRLNYGASPISETLLERAMQVFPAAELAQGYGMTEMAPAIAALTPEDHHDARLLRAAGRAVAGVDLRIVDAEDREVPRGAVGEIVVRGANTMLGYWNKPGETAAALRGGWMHTGDAAFMDDNGYVYIVDRVKDMIVSGGENVYSAEVENAVAAHPAVAACAVIGIPDSDWGERVHAVIVLKPGHTATTTEIRDHCKSLIARYKAPRSCDFVDAMPLSPAGKILKRELRKPYWSNSERNVN